MLNTFKVLTRKIVVDRQLKAVSFNPAPAKKTTTQQLETRRQKVESFKPGQCHPRLLLLRKNISF